MANWSLLLAQLNVTLKRLELTVDVGVDTADDGDDGQEGDVTSWSTDEEDESDEDESGDDMMVMYDVSLASGSGNAGGLAATRRMQRAQVKARSTPSKGTSTRQKPRQRRQHTSPHCLQRHTTSEKRPPVTQTKGNGHVRRGSGASSAAA